MAPDTSGAIANDNHTRLKCRVIVLSKCLEVLLEAYVESDKCNAVEAATILKAIAELEEPI